MRCELCPDLTCTDNHETGGRTLHYNNGKDAWLEESTVSVDECTIRLRHEHKDLLKHLHKSLKRQNLNHL